MTIKRTVGGLLLCLSFSAVAEAQPPLRVNGRMGGRVFAAKLPDGAHIDGTLLRAPNGEIDVVYGGARFHVPDPATLTRMFGSRKVTQLGQGQLEHIGLIPWNGTLLRDQQSGEIDVVYNGKRYHVPNPTVFDQMGFAGKQVHELWANGLKQIPEAAWPPPLPARPARDVSPRAPSPARSRVPARSPVRFVPTAGTSTRRSRSPKAAVR